MNTGLADAVRLETAPTGGENVYLFLEIYHKFATDVRGLQPNDLAYYGCISVQ